MERVPPDRVRISKTWHSRLTNCRYQGLQSSMLMYAQLQALRWVAQCQQALERQWRDEWWVLAREGRWRDERWSAGERWNDRRSRAYRLTNDDIIPVVIIQVYVVLHLYNGTSRWGSVLH